MRKRAFTRSTSLVTQRPALAPLAAGLLLLSGQALAVSDMSRSIYAVELDPAELNAVQSLLPEQRVNSAFVNSAVDPNLRLLEDAEVSVTFIDEGAGYQNSFGYFLFDDEQSILDKRTIFANASKETAKKGKGAAANKKFGGLEAGDTVDIGKFDAGTNIGFWLKGNGFADPNGHTYYTLDHLNPDGFRHVAMINDAVNEQIVLGVEDLFNLGDQDFNDIVFTVSASPFSALDVDGLPTGAPEAGPIATALISASLLGAYARRRGRSARRRG
ncbi:hypothetical protein CKO31_07520 [Thiohalocapsa halophila]|uniref:DUF4114 domain-containing protein n=1 Tax=Thiohalocapsa halophila TaxID=69359 RepID=A0ABS1CFD9_9GAMM|nr:DUF4114 domain-containing protein [Thiohalocapsa halophila]MBK1630595.1 hypothetical protein [Thiohalocapsa halophila]